MEQDNAVTPDLIDALDYAIHAVISNKNRRGRRPKNPFENLDYFFDEFLGGRRWLIMYLVKPVATDAMVKLSLLTMMVIGDV